MPNYFDKFPASYVEDSKRVINTPSALARSAFFYVQETGYLKLKESHVAKRKNLNSYLLVLVLSGKGTLTYDGQIFPLSKNSCFFIDCLKPYSHQSSTDEPWELLWVHFHGATSASYYKYFETSMPPAFSPSNADKIREKLELLLSINLNGDMLTEITSSKLILDLMTLILISGSQDVIQETKSHAKMREIRSYLAEHCTEAFSLDALAEQFFISKYHLSREFKRIYGITPNAYVISKRITLAKRLLRYSDKNMEEISRLCGFYDSSYLNKQFKKSEGLSASDYRKKWMNEPHE